MVSFGRFKLSSISLVPLIAVLVALALGLGFAYAQDAEQAQRAHEAELVRQAGEFIAQAQDGRRSVEDRADAVRKLDGVYQRMHAIYLSEGELKWTEPDGRDEFKSMHHHLPGTRARLVESLADALKAKARPRLKPAEVQARLAELLTVRAEEAQAEVQMEVQTPPKVRPWELSGPPPRPPNTDDQRLRQMIQELEEQTDWYRNELADIRRSTGPYFRRTFRSIFPDYHQESIDQMAERFAEDSGSGTTAFITTEISTVRRLEDDWAWVLGVLDKKFDDLREDYFVAQDTLREHLLIKYETWSLDQARGYPASTAQLCDNLVSIEQMLVWSLGAPTFEESERRARPRAEARKGLEEQQHIVLRLWLKWMLQETRDASLGSIGTVWDFLKAAEKQRLEPLKTQAEKDYNAALGELNERKRDLMSTYFRWRIKDGLERAIAMDKFRPHLKTAGDSINFYRNLLFRSPPADADEYERLKNLGFFKNCQSEDTYRELLSQAELDALREQNTRRISALGAAAAPGR